jgi:hypothetical protein
MKVHVWSGSSRALLVHCIHNGCSLQLQSPKSVFSSCSPTGCSLPWMGCYLLVLAVIASTANPKQRAPINCTYVLFLHIVASGR